MLQRSILVWTAMFALSQITAWGVTVTVYHNDVGAFDTAAGNPPVSLDFDALAPGTLLGGVPIGGLVMTSPDGNTLEVVEGAATTTNLADFNWYSATPQPDTNKLFPTSGANVLSPGGSALVPGPQLGQRDSLRIDFLQPVAAFGLDVLFQSLDLATYTGFKVEGLGGTVLASGTIPGNGAAGGAPGGSLFVGFVADAAEITAITFTETDGDNGFPDANIGFDTFRYGTAVPEPATLGLALGLALARGARRITRR